MPRYVSSPIDKYKVVLYAKEETAGNLMAYIHCYYKGRNVMTCEFYQDGGALPESRDAGGRVGLAYPWSYFAKVIDILRNEKPIYFGFNDSSKVGYITTQEEPVGEGADQS